jgi:hypothetical protein
MKTFLQYYNEMNTAGPGGVLGTYTDVGGAFPATGDAGYAPGDSRALSPYGPAGAVLGAKIKGKKRKKLPQVKFKVQRRPLPGLSL